MLSISVFSFVLPFRHQIYRFLSEIVRNFIVFIEKRHSSSSDRKRIVRRRLSITQDCRKTLVFSQKSQELAFKAVLRCMGGDLSAVLASASRRPRTSMCLVKAGSRPVQIATPAFQSNPGLPRFPPRSSGVLSTIFDKIVGHLTLSPQGHALVANLISLNSPLSKLSGTCPLCLSTKATEGNHP